jgi:ubiquinone/menaquinone biosynthesis C-methylase UbiE
MSPRSGLKQLSADWYTAAISENLLKRLWHTLRFQELNKVITPVRGRVLDIGSADGTFTKIIFDKARPGKLVGIDIFTSSISYAKRRFARSKKINFRNAHAEDIPYADSQFDAIFCLETLHFVENIDEVIKEISRVLTPGGYVVIMNTGTNLLVRRVFTPFSDLPKPRKFTEIQIKNSLNKYGLEIEDNRKLLGGIITTIRAKKR